MKPSIPMPSCRLRPAFLLIGLIALAPVTPIVAAASAPADAAKVEVPIISTDEAVKKELLTLDQLLETNPQLEEKLRNNLEQLTQETFRMQNPDVDALLKRQPGIVPALKKERHFFVHRSIARLARTPLLRKDAIALDKFLSDHPDIVKALSKKRGQIVSGDFLVAHPPLAAFMEKHPSLSTVLLQQAQKKEGATKAPQKR
jgi:hypothetical protein